MINVQFAAKIRLSRRSSQGGMALIMGLIILLVATMIGVIAIRSSTQQGRMAGSYQQQAQSFQFADSAIRLVMAQLNFRGRPGANVPATARRLDLVSLIVQTNRITTNTERNEAAPDASPALQTANGSSGVFNMTASTASTGGSGFNSGANFYWTGICGDGTSPCPRISGFSFKDFSAFSFEINAVSQQPRTFARSNNIQGLIFVGPKAE